MSWGCRPALVAIEAPKTGMVMGRDEEQERWRVTLHGTGRLLVLMFALLSFSGFAVAMQDHDLPRAFAWFSSAGGWTTVVWRWR